MRYEIEMPAGAHLRSDGNRGAEVAMGDEVLDWIPFPVAFDAQGTQVPVELSIDGDSIALKVAHREADVAYPILVDPHHILEDWVNANWFNGYNTYALDIGAWQYTENMSWIEGETHCIYQCWGWRGLYVSMFNGNHNPNEFGHWAYSTPNSHTWLVNAWAIPFWRDDHGCNKNQYPRPYDYVGMWSAAGHWNRVLMDEAINVGSVDIQSAGEAFILGLSTGAGAPIPCWRDLGVGGVAIWLDDSQNPSLDSVSIGGTKNGWLSDLTTASITATARDEGLGVRMITMFPEGKSLLTHEVGCTGLAGNRCPNTRSWQRNFTGDSLGEGRRFVQVSAEDPLGKASGTYETYTWVDRSAPEVSLSGQLAEATEDDVSETQGDKTIEKLRLPVYSLKIEAKDGSLANNYTKRSGVKDIKVFLDGVQQEVPWQPTASCPETSCAKTETYQLKLSKLDVAGLHKLKVVVTDFVGKVKERELEFDYFPATGMKDEYVMQYFPLPDGLGNEAEEEHPDRPELAVNVMNGNLVYREKDIEVEGPAVDLEVERYYNSMLPEAESTEWGDGWTLAQTPDLKPADTGGSPAPDEADLLESSGAIEGGVGLPTEVGVQEFDPGLQATLTKKAGGGFEMTDDTGESATSVVFGEAGQTETRLTEGFAKVDYAYENGNLSEIKVADPATFAAGPAEQEPPEEQPIGEPTYAFSFGTNGSGDGQLKSPGDVAVDDGGNVWVVDKGNNRIQKFDSTGKFLAKFGSAGTGNGQLNRPASIAIASDGNLLVADANNHRIQKFSPAGQFISKFGTAGAEAGQFSGPESVAVDSEGNIWVADTYNGRLQKFDSTGAFLAEVGSYGAEPGQLGEPTGIDVAPNGNIWVADWQNDRISVFDPEGEFLFDFGSIGTADGEFHQPDEVEVDADGNVWVGDQSNGRVQRFDLEGNYIDQFGSKGSGAGQFSFSYPMGIATDPGGHLWVTDVNNHRIQQWLTTLPVELDLSDGDPSVEIETEDDLVSSVTGDAAGTHTYEHDGRFLISHDGPNGETAYEKTAAGLLSKVTLPNGTWAAISYRPDGRVESVTVAPEGANVRTTYFYYQDAPTRRTVVDLPNDPNVTYDIGSDGSVFKWANTEKPPEIDPAGTLWDAREKSGYLEPGNQELEVAAESTEGVASIQIIANGSDLVDEATCDEDRNTPQIECEQVNSLWVTHTSNHAPGYLYLEIMVTDQSGNIASERFWVDIPEPPPPPAPGTPIAPTFEEIADFREEYGLEVVFPVEDETELAERINNLIGYWHNPNTPLGAVARASWERWGIPLRPEDVAEMEFREHYMTVNIPRIEEWAELHRAGTYAGYYIDHAAGGILHVGFTQGQATSLADLKEHVSLEAPDRLAIYQATPAFARASLSGVLQSIENLWSSDPLLESALVSAGIDEKTNSVEVTGPDPSQIDARLRTLLGQSVPIRAVYEEAGEEYDGRNHVEGRVQGGDRIIGATNVVKSACTAGFGAWERVGTKPNGEAEIAPFLLTAGHCARPGYLYYRTPVGGKIDPNSLAKIGHVARTGLPRGGQHYETDGSAIKLNAGGVMPYYIFMNGQPLKPVGPPGRVHHGETLCFSGMATNEPKRCGEVIGVRVRQTPNPGRQLFLITRFAGIPGDSGAPVWSPRLQRSIGILSGGPGIPGLVKDWVTPLLQPRGHDSEKVPGILNAPGMGALNLAVPGS